MPDIVLLGINHETASVELRECLAFSEDETADALVLLHKNQFIKEALIFSTCNRVEVLIVTEDRSKGADAAKAFLEEYKKVPAAQFEDALYVYKGDEAVRHIFRVASSLDSMVVGEPQILGQIKEAYRSATLKKTSGVILNRLLHRTFFVAKKVRSETGIGDHAVSISYAAIELGRKIFDTLESKKVLLIGAGEMAELAVEHLIRNRTGEIFVANRTFKRGVELSKKFKGQAIRFEELTNFLKEVDIIISSTGSSDFILRPEQVKMIMPNRRNRPLFFIDIAVPRDIDPKINRLNNSYVYDIDDLKGIVDENIGDRKAEAIKGERIVDEAVIRFREWYDSLDVVPTIVALRSKLEIIAKKEIEKTMQSNSVSGTDSQAIQRMTDSIINKFLHDPTLVLKGNGIHRDKSVYLDVARKLFRLDK
ncbi:MAG: glutamyl-tRNA reductase [Desulfobacterales bacterium]|nr:glutamyl-tRNA reductase [Deltaproteobacteria bacterium]NNL40934.1 glutamyl-tRNA reductase [Desulfobacterales bacterium]